MKFLHAADVHLDSPLRGLDRYEGAPAKEIRGATRKALANLVSLALDEEVDFVILAGDLSGIVWLRCPRPDSLRVAGKSPRKTPELRPGVEGGLADLDLHARTQG